MLTHITTLTFANNLLLHAPQSSKTLYFVSNSSGGAPPSPDLVIEAVQQHTLLSVVGESMDKPVVGLSLQGLGFRDAAPT